MTQGSNYYCMDKTNSVESPLTNNHMVASSCNSESNSSAMVCSGANNCLVCSICSPSYTSAYPSPCSMASSDCCSCQLLVRTSHASSYSCSNPMVCSSDLCTQKAPKAVTAAPYVAPATSAPTSSPASAPVCTPASYSSCYAVSAPILNVTAPANAPSCPNSTCVTYNPALNNGQTQVQCYTPSQYVCTVSTTLQLHSIAWPMN